MGDSLLRFFQDNTTTFKTAFDMATFTQRYGTASSTRSNAFEDAPEFKEHNVEWQRRTVCVGTESIRILLPGGCAAGRVQM